MDLKEIANELVAGCREGREKENLTKLYASDAVSVEAMAGPDGSRETTGVDGIRGKHEWWETTFDVLDGSVSDPMPHGDNRFAVIFELKTRNKENGEVQEMKEVALYHVDGGKIVKEEFFYPTG